MLLRIATHSAWSDGRRHGGALQRDGDVVARGERPGRHLDGIRHSPDVLRGPVVRRTTLVSWMPTCQAPTANGLVSRVARIWVVAVPQGHLTSGDGGGTEQRDAGVVLGQPVRAHDEPASSR